MRLEQLINTYSQYMKNRYKRRVYRVGLSLGIPCPHRAEGGCIFCNPETFRGKYQVEGRTIAEQLKIGKEIIKKHTGAEKFAAYFQDETSTAGDIEYLQNAFETTLADEDVLELAVSTRPDYVNKDVITLFKRLNKPATLEIGLQSIHEKSLYYLRRGHNFSASRQALDLCAEFGIRTGVHLILGIPGETQKDMLATIKWISSRPEIKEVKFHNLVIYKGTELAEMWKRKEVKQQTIRQHIDNLCQAITFLRKDIVISRLFTSNMLFNDLQVEKFPGNKTKWMNELRLELIKRQNLQQVNPHTKSPECPQLSS